MITMQGAVRQRLEQLINEQQISISELASWSELKQLKKLIHTKKFSMNRLFILS